jgi:hypothetical protein
VLAATITQPLLFEDDAVGALEWRFDQPHASSDGGAILLRRVDRRLRLIDHLAAVLRDPREPTRVQHTMCDLLAQRIFGIACGHIDANDGDALAHDPVHKTLLGRDPITGDRLASQPTLSRFEQVPSPQVLYAMGEVLADVVIASLRRRFRDTKVITLDLDATADPTHGAQQLSIFNGFYDTWCYLPLVATLAFEGAPRQYLVAALLRPGNAGGATGVRGLLRRLIPKLWRAFPRARVRVRLDSGFASPAIFAELEHAGVDYVVGMAGNAVLDRLAAPHLAALRAQVAITGETATHYHEATYQAETWPHARRVIIKAEVVAHPGRDPRDNPRFVITNLRHRPGTVYTDIYCARGDSENRIKELHDALGFGRTSCTRFWANQFRVLLSAAAYALLQHLQLYADQTTLRGAQVPRLRQALITIGVWIVREGPRLIWHAPRGHPEQRAWAQMARALGATAR